jgi:predicted TPR repeat methyltransferase
MDLSDTTADPETLIQRADELLGARRPGAARALLAAAQRMAPRAPRMASLAARLEMREGHPEASLTALGQAIAASPRADLFMLRADARWQLGDLAGAVADAAEAVIHDRGDPAAKALLGVLMLELGHPEDAVRCLTEAVDMVPTNPWFREGLAGALAAGGRPDAAAATYADGIAAAPGSVELRNAAIMFAVRVRDFATAVALAEAARVVGMADATTYGLMGHALASLGRHVEATDAYADALKLGPEDPYVRRVVAAADVPPDATRAPVDYVRRVFDSYADRFEGHLIGLGYRIPGVMRNAVRARLLNNTPTTTADPVTPDTAPPDLRAIDPRSLDTGTLDPGMRALIGPVLDLGCGTGLAAVALSDLPLGPWIGVDLSPRMLRLAAAKRLYAALHDADIIDFLTEDLRHWGLILAADVLCYVGLLEPLFAAVHARLLPGALFLCSAEELVGPYYGNGDWALGRQGRFSHARDYIDRVARAAGFAVRAIDAEVQRQDAGAPVAGFLIVLERSHALV